MKPQCPECGSKNINGDFDTIDGAYDYWAWWHCIDCDHQWRYSDATQNPDAKLKAGSETEGS